MFTKAIVRKPSATFIDGLSSANLGVPDHEKALRQHEAYTAALTACGLEVVVMPPDEKYPDATFVEDCAVVTPNCAVITRPGAPSRNGEQKAVARVLADFYPHLAYIDTPGTLDGGDVMQAGDSFFIGLSERTNRAGARQLAGILSKHGYRAELVPLTEMLHLKTGLSYLENNRLIWSGEYVGNPVFAAYQTLEIPSAEAYAANSLWVNGTVLVPEGFPRTEELLRDCGYTTRAVAVSEFQKLDGGLSCLSIRF